MANVFVFRFHLSLFSDLLRYNNKEEVTIISKIGTLVAVEHYKRQGSLSSKDSHQILVSAFIHLWPLKICKGRQPYNLRTQHLYDKALQLQHQPDRFNQFCRIDTADKACAVTFTNAIASFPAEQKPKQRRAIFQPQQPLQSHPRHHWPSMFCPLLVFVAILVILGRLCMPGSFTLRPSRHQPQQQRHPPWVQEQKLFFLRRTWNHYHYDYLILLALVLLMLMLIMWMLPFKLMKLCCFRQADNHAAKLHLHRHRTTRSTKGVTPHEPWHI